MGGYSKLLYPYQNIRLIKPYVYRIGINDILLYKIKNESKINNKFYTSYKKINTNVKPDDILSTLFNLDTNKYYLFYTPYKGKIVNTNNILFNNINNILKQPEEKNWLFDININPNLKYTTYS